MATEEIQLGATARPRKTRVQKRVQTNAGRLHHAWYVPYLFILPGFALYVLWMLYPLAYEFYISFYDWKIIPGQQSTFIGLDNYQRALNDETFWQVLWNTFRYTAVTVMGQMILGLVVAIMVHRIFVAKRLFRAIYYLPVVTSWVVVSIVFRYIFSSSPAGMMNYLLVDVFQVVKEPVSWVRQPGTAWIIIYALGIWKGVGWTMVIFLAALQGIPVDLYEAAAIDGAGMWSQFRYVTLPMIRRTTVFVLVALVIGGFQVFISVLLITQGKPLHRTDVMLNYIYETSFDGRLAFGYGAAMSYLLTAIIVGISFAQMWFFNRNQETE